MINVSKEFRDTMRTRRDFREYADITLASGEVLNLEAKDFTVANNSITDGAGASALPLGEAVEKSIQIEIMNDNDQFSQYDFFGARIKLYLKFQLSKSIETVHKGTYTVVTPESYGTVISITAVDDMYKADKEYDSDLIYPTTVGEILRDACSKCDIPLLTTTFANSTQQVTVRPTDTTYRQVIGYCAMFAAGNARIDVNGHLNIIPYDFSAFESLDGLNGGVFDIDTPYSSGDSADGGTFNPWNTGDTYDGGIFGDRDDIHILYSFKNLTVDTDDVVITGVQIELEDNEVYISGETGYMFSVENPLFSGIEKNMVDYLASRLVGIRMRKFSGDHVADPTIEAYDLAYIIDRKQNGYQTIITDVDFTVFGYTNISNSAESAIRNSSKYYTSISKAVVEARKNTQEQLSDYDLAVQQMTSIMANSLGMFQTVEKTESGGEIVYQHNKPTVEESDTIWKKSEAGFQVSTDGGKTWNAGMDAQGNAFLNVLSVIGINADWINAGTITGRQIKGSEFIGGSIEITYGDEQTISFVANQNGVGIGMNGEFMTYYSGNDFLTLNGELRVSTGKIVGYRNGEKGIEMDRTLLHFYAWNEAGNYVGSIGSIRRNSDGRVGIEMWCDKGDLLWLGYSSEPENPQAETIIPFFTFDSSTPDKTPVMANTAIGGNIFSRVDGGGIVVENGLIKSWNFQNLSTGYFETSSWRVDVKNGLIVGITGK